MNRRQFFQVTGGTAAMLALTGRNAYAFSQSMALSKFAQPLRGVSLPPYSSAGIPVLLPDVSTSDVDHYSVVVKQYTDQLHPWLPPTKLWGYADYYNQVNRHLGGIVIARRNKPVQMTFVNRLPPSHILPVDPTVMGGSLPQNRIATHLHGGLVPWISDGGPFDWFLPDGRHGDSFLNNSVTYPVAPPVLGPGQGEYFYPNNQSARLVWYHDHAFGITRLNASAGIASGYIIRDPAGPEGALIAAGLPSYIEAGGLEVPLIVQDKIFKNGNPQSVRTYPQYELPVGDLWYPYTYDRSRWTLSGTKIPKTPSCIPEYFGDTMLVNGTVYPTATLPPRRVRFRVLNACNGRFLNLQILVKDFTADGITLNSQGTPTNAAGPPILQIGNECGFLNAPVLIPAKSPFAVTFDPFNGNPTCMNHGLLMAPAERADIIVDFNGCAQGTRFVLYTDCPAPFPDGDALNDYKPHFNGCGPDTRTLMEIVIGSANGVPADPPLSLAGLAMDPPPLVSPANPTVPDGVPVRRLPLNETFDSYGRLFQMLGTDQQVAGGYARAYMDAATETIAAGSTEVWRIFNTTADTHPMHFHLINLQIVSRQPYNVTAFLINGTELLGTAYAPDPNEQGWKETIRMNPGEVTTVIAKFDLPANVPFTCPSSPRAGSNGLGVTAPAGQAVHEYVWHCHILEHEEHDMMRPLVVVG
jgi:spore coat protein A